MKDRKTFGVRGKNKDRRKTGKYTDEYIEELYEEAPDEEAFDEEPFDDEEAYIVAYSSDQTVVGAYTSEEMQEYAEEYEETQEDGEFDAYEEYDAQEYDEAEAYKETLEYEDTEAYEEPEEYEEAGEYEELEDYEEAEAYEELEEYEESGEYEELEEYEEAESYEELEEYEEAESYEEGEEYEEAESYEELEEYEEADEYEELEEYEESESYEELEEYEETGAYNEVGEYEEAGVYETASLYEELEEYEEAEEYEENGLYEAQEYGDYEGTGNYAASDLEDDAEAYEIYEGHSYQHSVNYESGEELYNTKEINIETFVAEDYAEDTESYYEPGEEAYEEDEEAAYYESEEYYDEFDDDAYYEEAYYDASHEAYNEDSFDTAYGGYNDDYANDGASFGAHAAKEPLRFADALRERLHHLTAFDAVLAATGVVVLVAGIVILSMFLQSRAVDKQIAALAPLGGELKNMGVAGEEGLLAMSGAALSGAFAQDLSTEEASSTEEETSETASGKVNVSFVSVEKDLKIRFTDEYTGELITGTVFEVTLTNAKGKKLVLTDDDMDGIIYAQNVNAGVFDAIITSTEKYTFPSVPQQVTVKDKVEYVVINVQDEVKTEKQINVSAEDTEKNDAAAEAEVLKDTVEWVESTKTPVSGTESYLLVDQNTIADPAQISKAAARMLFDTLNVSLDKSEVTLSVGAATELKGTAFEDSKEGDIEYQYATEWKSSDESVASVSGGKVTAKAAGTAVITYTVTKKTITTTTESKEPVEETLEISLEEYAELSDEEKEKCTPIKDDADQTIGYTYKKVTAGSTESKTSETTETASAQCTVTVQEAEIVSGSLELQKSADSCAVGETLTVKPVKLVYQKQDGSTETITENFPSILWDSDDVTIATVGTDGVVSGVKAGKVQISGKVTGMKDAEGRELDIRSSVEVEIKEAASEELSVTLDRTSDVYLAVGGSTTLVATVTNYKSDAGVTWETSDKKVATVDEKGVVTGVAPGSVTITAVTKEKDAQDKPKKAACVVTINSNAASDTTTKLKDKNGNQIYIKNSDGSYKEAVYADYYSSTEFYIAAQPQYLYTGWQTIDGKTYFYDKNGNVVTGTQIIQGVTYNFGTDGAIATSVNGSTFGIDVSRHNGTIDWKAVKASGVDYVIIRCGYRGSLTGALIEDQSFRTNIKGATAAGLKVGVYVFSQAINEVEAVKEASLAVSLVKGYHLTYPIFIDTESSGGRADKIDRATRTAVVNAFCQTVASAGYKPGIYASKTWFEDKLNMGAIGNYKIWLAQYSTAPTYKGRYDMWQYSSKGTISGISTKVDLNYSYLGY